VIEDRLLKEGCEVIAGLGSMRDFFSACIFSFFEVAVERARQARSPSFVNKASGHVMAKLKRKQRAFTKHCIESKL